MSKKELEREYTPSSCIDDIMVYIRKYGDQSQAVNETLNSKCQKYGPEKRSHMDIFVPGGEGPYPVHVFIHGGYWQELSKTESTFAAPNFTNHNIIFIALDYSLAPEANMFEIIDQVKRGFMWVLDNIENYQGDKNNITLSGSSAGGHLVAEVLSIDWPKYGYDDCPIRGACEVSGIFDLRPLALTSVNKPLGMSEEDASQLSPLFHIPKHACPVIFSYGENETTEFKRQTQDYMNAWQEAGHVATYIDMLGFNHFDIILELNNKNSPLFRAILEQIL